jgi:hypothetical protein
MAKGLQDRPGHGGIITKLLPDGRAQNAPLGFWPEQLDAFNAHPSVGQARTAFVKAVHVGQKYHERNEALMIAKASRTEVLLPEPNIRRADARREQRELSELQKQVNALQSKSYDQSLALRERVLTEPSTTPAALARQAELRQWLRSVDDKTRLEAIEKRHAFRMAALSHEPELSGLTQPMHALLVAQEIKSRFPKESAEIEATHHAAEVATTALKGANAAVHAEILALGDPITPTVEPQQSKRWA